GETGTLQLQVREAGSSAVAQRELVLQDWLRGANDPDPLGSLGIERWMPSGPPLVADLLEGGVAERAGVQKGDLLLSLDGQELDSPAEVVSLAKGLAGKRGELVYQRGEQVLRVDLQLPADPEVIAK